MSLFWELNGGQDLPLWSAAPAALIGLALGSFGGMLTYRLPRGLALDRPGSFCPSCRARIGWRRNVPLVSFLVQRGRCADCAAPIHWRYPFSEALGGLLALACWQAFGAGLEAVAALLFCMTLLTLALIDLEHGLLPDRLTLGLLWLGLGCSLAPKPAGGGALPVSAFPGPAQAIAGAIAGYAFLWAVNAIWRQLRKREGMGGGDLKLLAALGAWVGWSGLPLVVAPAAIMGAATGLVLIALGRASLSDEIPFGPFLAAGGVFTLLWGPQAAFLLDPAGFLARAGT